jgi:hypothetical protein
VSVEKFVVAVFISYPFLDYLYEIMGDS